MEMHVFGNSGLIGRYKRCMLFVGGQCTGVLWTRNYSTSNAKPQRLLREHMTSVTSLEQTARRALCISKHSHCYALEQKALS